MGHTCGSKKRRERDENLTKKEGGILIEVECPGGGRGTALAE